VAVANRCAALPHRDGALGAHRIGHRVWITLAQDAPAFAATVRVRVTTPTGRTEYQLDVSAARQEFVLDVPARPESASLDPDFRILRLLDPAEMPPILRQVMVDPATVTVAASTAETVRAAAADLSRALLITRAHSATPATRRGDSPLLVIGLSADVTNFWPAQPFGAASAGGHSGHRTGLDRVQPNGRQWPSSRRKA